MRPLLAIFALSATLARAQGPIETRNGTATSLAFLRLSPRGSLLQPGERSFHLDFLSANNLRFSNAAREDQETERFNFGYRWGVGRGEWSLDVPFMMRNGGFQDPLIEGWHELLGIHNFRKTIPYYRSEETIPGSGSFGNAAGFGDISIGYSRNLSRHAFVTTAVKVPTGNAAGLLGSGNVDFAASLYGNWRVGRHFAFYTQLGGVVQGDASQLAHNRTLVDQESVAFEYVKNWRDSYVLQWQSEPSALIIGNKFFDGPHRQLSLGFNRRINPEDSLQFYFNEDGDFLNFRVPELANVAPDFTIGVNFTHRW